MQDFLVPDRRDILPLPYIIERSPGLRRSGRQRKKRRKQKWAIDAANKIIYALNAMSRGELPRLVEPTKWGTIQLKSRGRKPTACQVVAHQRILNRCYEAICRGLLAPIADVSVGVEPTAYNGIAGQGAVLLEPAEVSLPPKGVAGSVDLLRILPAVVRDKYEKPDEVVLCEPVKPEELRRFPVFAGTKPGKYVALIDRLVDVGIVSLSREKPLVVNGIFGVPKPDNSQRLIIDAQRANLYFPESPEFDLPNPGDLVNLCMVGKQRLFMAKADMDNFYHRLKLPQWLTTYFGLPSVVRHGERLWPRMRVLPMGWSHSVYLAHTAHVHVVETRVGLPAENRIGLTHPSTLDRFSHGQYIDDYFSIGTDLEQAKTAIDSVVHTCEKLHLNTNAKKLIKPGPENVTILGIECTASGRLEPSREKFRVLLFRTKRLLGLRVWNKEYLSHVLGCWIWFLLLNRPLFSVLQEVYKFLHSLSKKAGKPPVRARQELNVLVVLAPLIYADWKLPLAEKALCTDASLIGGAVVYTSISLKEGLELLGSQSRFKGCSGFFQNKNTEGKWIRMNQFPEWLQSHTWKTAVAHKWKYPKHIHILEGEALILGLRWWCRTQNNLGSRVPVFIDNQTLISAITKGRSSSKSLQHICRKVAALCLAGNIKLIEGWVPSEQNPADAPSRHL